ncbi:AlkA N-terminal domain-containing protein [Saccharospirillum alexandrii]|uniref:AlkA N-terminal domain-containing protein n=1 Tax=Saccharospirillum alexandrii TaxID=2448477 RepID=UPI000FD82A01|nr:AlkA N-terminal domain-containing protein [Saccharospirillum alexandrii]
MTDRHYQQARLARDHRFDGRFFVAVKTTGIYCRPICPAPAPKEQNVCYFETAIAAANAGFRPCLRCRPDSAPASWAWKGTDTTLERALRLIDDGALITGSVTDLADRLGITSRYLGLLFQRSVGTSPKQYGLYQQVLFAKSLLQQTDMPITDVALASGFSSVRRFNDCFASVLQMTPRSLRRPTGKRIQEPGIRLLLSYRPPYDWAALRDFLQTRLIETLEWCGDDHYGRTFRLANGAAGRFTARHRPERFGFDVSLQFSQAVPLLPVVRTIRRLLDLDADSNTIDAHLAPIQAEVGPERPGLRLPGTWDAFEAGIRAILGQQISVAAARNLVRQLVAEQGEVLSGADDEQRLFPTPAALANSDLASLKIPGRRRQTLIDFARFFDNEPDQAADPEHWLALSGIGPWTVNYARMRGLGDSDVWLGSDLGVKKALGQAKGAWQPADASPWQSYLTFYMWSLL